VLIIKIHPPTKLPRKYRHIRSSSRIPKAFAKHICPQHGHVRASPYPQLNQAYPGSSNSYRTYLALGPDMSGQAAPSQRLSPSRTYLAEQPSSRGRCWTYLVPGPDMSNSSALARVRPLHRTCLVPRVGS
jgi:hypothetical protein